MEEGYKRLIEEIRDVFFIVEGDTLVLVNNYGANLYGYSVDELIGTPFMELVAPEERERLAELYLMKITGQQAPDITECGFLAKDGSMVLGEVSVWPTLFEGQPAIAGIVRDITERKFIMEKLQDSEEKYRSIVENSPDMIVTVDPEGVILSLDGAVMDIMGYTPGEMIGRNVFELVPPESLPRAVENFSQACSGNTATSHIIVKGRGGTEHCLEFRALPVFQDGTIVRIQGVIRDITEKIKNEEKLNRMFEGMTDSIMVTDMKGVITEINKSSLEMYGHDSKDKLIGKKAFDFLSAEDVQRAIDNMQKTLEEGTISNVVNRICRGGGSVIYCESSVSVLKDAYGKPEGYIAITRDITENRQTEEKFRQLLEDMNDGYGVLQDGKYVFVNKRFGEIFGYEPSQIIGMTFDQFIHPESRQSKLDEYRGVLEGNDTPAERHENKAIRSDGKGIMAEATVKGIQYDNKPAFSVIIRDVTERHMAEAARREYSEMLRLMFECAPYGVAITDLNAAFIDGNDHAIKLLGCKSKSEFLSKSAFDYLPKNQHRRAMRDIERCMQDGSLLGFEYVVKREDNSKMTAQASAGVLMGFDNNPIGMVVIARDITEEKQLRENKQFYISEIIKAQENERKSLARALHDDTVQELLLASHRLQDAIAGNQGRLPKKAQRHLEELRKIIEKLMTDVRAFSVDLRPGVLDDMGLIPALRWLTKRLHEGESVESGLKVLGKERRLPPETELSLFRIAQESLTNIRKHANASTARITLQFDEDKVTLSIADNGRGFEVPHHISQFTREHKLGLTGISERVSLLGGQCKFDSTPGKGTSIRVEIGD